MKQKSKIILYSLSHMTLFMAVIFAAGSLKQPDSHISKIDATPPTGQSKTKHSSEQTTSSVILASKTHASSSSSVITTSPKYDDIKQSIQQEIVYRMFATPNDPRYTSNWALTKVNAPAAWDVTTGNGQTVVAVIDTGFGLNHEDLASQWFQNQGEMGSTQPGGRCWTGTSVSKQTNNCDDDNNGYVDDWRGWSFVNHDNNPQAGRTVPGGTGTQHGTEVAGIVGASSNNSLGIVAIDWNTKIMPLQALNDDGIGYTSDITAAIYYAVDNGAGVINLSLGAYANDPALKTAVNYATAHGVVIVAAAGNCGDGTNDECAGIPAGTIAYPAAYPDVIAVGATTQSDQRASFSSFGANLDVSAPGYAIPSSTSWSANNQTSLYSGTLYGTSFASPQVASLAALIKSIRPSTSVADVTALIDATATKPSGMNGQFYADQFGHGVINSGSALSIATLLNTSSATPTLLQAGSFMSEHAAPTGSALGSGCQTSGGACTVQLTDSIGNKRFLPYVAMTSDSTGWSWLSDSLDSDNWELRARSGELLSTTPYFLFRK